MTTDNNDDNDNADIDDNDDDKEEVEVEEGEEEKGGRRICMTQFLFLEMICNRGQDDSDADSDDEWKNEDL